MGGVYQGDYVYGDPGGSSLASLRQDPDSARNTCGINNQPLDNNRLPYSLCYKLFHSIQIQANSQSLNRYSLSSDEFRVH